MAMVICRPTEHSKTFYCSVGCVVIWYDTGDIDWQSRSKKTSIFWFVSAVLLCKNRLHLCNCVRGLSSLGNTRRSFCWSRSSDGVVFSIPLLLCSCRKTAFKHSKNPVAFSQSFYRNGDIAKDLQTGSVGLYPQPRRGDLAKFFKFFISGSPFLQ